jgi:hypothetical protein
VAAGLSLDLVGWRAEFDGLMGVIAGRFARVESRRLAHDAVLGLMSPLAVKNCWTLAEHAGHDSPDRLQHLLGKAKWDTDGVRNDLRGYVVDRLGDRDAVLICDETGDVKKGDRTVGVQRQYTGTAGRIENAQVAVYLTYASNRCAWPDAAGQSRNRFRPARISPGSISTRFADGPAGIAGPSWRCSPTPYSLPSPRPNEPKTQPHKASH